MIFRIWHGWTTPENSDIYENLLKNEIFPEIASKNVSGYRGIQLLRRQLSDEVEFITIMQFDSLEAVKQFAGDDYEKSYVPDKARKVLSRHDDRSQHYEMKESIMYWKGELQPEKDFLMRMISQLSRFSDILNISVLSDPPIMID